MKMLHVSGEKVSAEACGLDSVKCARKYQTIWARKANLEIDKLKEKLGVPGWERTSSQLRERLRMLWRVWVNNIVTVGISELS